MVYIVSDERIAVENFEQGKIYKVEFVDESILYGVCIGIGSDFVMLSGDISGYIFPLTMQTASQVSSIDLYDPTPPEPPVPWTNLLQYQTGVPPFEFTTTDTSLFSWYVKGNLQQTGTPTPSAPIYPTEFNISAIKCNNLTTSISCEPLRKIGDNADYKNESVEYRAITKLELTGQESVTYDSANTRFSTLLIGMDYKGARATTFICSHYQVIDDGRSITNVPNNAAYAGGAVNYPLLFVKTDEYTSADDFKAFLSQQYANNTPVTVWYILATPTTTAAATPDITTDVGENELTVTADLQPSEMQIVYKIADR